MSDFIGLYSIRPLVEADKKLILATFLRGLYYGDSWFSMIPKDIFMTNYSVIANALLSSPNVLVNVACLPDDPNVILGYSIVSADYLTVHYVYVKSAWRKNGIAKALTPRHPNYVSHLTALGKSLLHKLPNATFNPFAL